MRRFLDIAAGCLLVLVLLAAVTVSHGSVVALLGEHPCC
ncbi:hypothetical protein BKA14_005680 [Actinoplanes abujensis]|uniref:Uncharacterized protein n=1 Tax=Paractinoplanes abujensis TaxID=882441 RepID=A0A7W7CVP8_9ACTN|nr:hypothetical protein [Actinoplanes abujensis]